MNKSLYTLPVSLMLSAGVTSLNAQEQQPVNFIQILTDDQGWGDLGSYGHDHIKSPNLDKLAKEGIKFTHCYSADAVCSPSRAAILTGRTPYRNGVYRWVPARHFCHLPKEEVTLPQLLRQNGYQTAHFGKWHLSHYEEKRTKTAGHYDGFALGGEIVGQPSMKEYGYDYWFSTGNVARPDHKDPVNFFLNGKPMGKMKGFSAQIVAEQFDKWMTTERKGNQPFFITIWFHEPHGPVNSDPEFLKLYENIDKPAVRQYLANITQIDEGVGAIVKSLKDAGVYDDTLIWYTSDNGPEGTDVEANTSPDSPYNNSRFQGSTGGLRGRKRHTHEGGIRVPGIITWPNGFKEHKVKPGYVCDEPIIGSDIFPTFLDIAGVKLPEAVKMDSTSILPLLQNKEFKRTTPLYWRNNYRNFRIALRSGDWKILGNSKRTKFELYNIALDPKETKELSGQEKERFETMKKALINYDKDVLAEGPDWWEREEKIKNVMPLSNK